MNIFVGNMSFKTTESELRQAFEQYGEVSSARIIMDRESNRPRGFGFVEMPNDDEARAAIQGLEGALVGGRNLRVNEARPRVDGDRGGRERRPPRRSSY